MMISRLRTFLINEKSFFTSESSRLDVGSSNINTFDDISTALAIATINFKEDFDYKIYLLIAGHSTFEQEKPYADIEAARNITTDLINNTNLDDNKQRAQSIKNMLGNLEKYVKEIENNKTEGGHYDDNISIWENFYLVFEYP